MVPRTLKHRSKVQVRIPCLPQQDTGQGARQAAVSSRDATPHGLCVPKGL